MTPTRVLLVDDSAAVRAVIQVYLALGKRPCELFEAQDGARGLHMARLMFFDVIFLDVCMPGMDGLAVLRELRSDPRPHVRDVPVILLTGAEASEMRDRGLAAGANDFLHKPVSVATLADALERQLARRSA